MNAFERVFWFIAILVMFAIVVMIAWANWSPAVGLFHGKP